MEKKFRFNLEAVLRQRRAEEDACQRDMAKAMRQRMILESQLRSMQQTITESKQELAEGLVGRIDLDGISSFARYSGQVRQRAMAFVTRLAGVEKQIGTARQQLLKATQARRALELLRDRRYQLWKKQRDTREAVELDEIAVQQYVRQTMLGAAK